MRPLQEAIRAAGDKQTALAVLDAVRDPLLERFADHLYHLDWDEIGPDELKAAWDEVLAP